tara:strand:+ start:577 stop:867 length:291 start_codon:yes stop_codon:yes gene_type:complete
VFNFGKISDVIWLEQKTRKVHTPGSQPPTPVERSRGRPGKHVKLRKNRRIYKKHDSDTLNRAVEVFKTGISIRSASELYEIPKSILIFISRSHLFF